MALSSVHRRGLWRCGVLFYCFVSFFLTIRRFVLSPNTLSSGKKLICSHSKQGKGFETSESLFEFIIRINGDDSVVKSCSLRGRLCVI
ncbi:hypothetical protein K2173_024446 [Erythroxylum novogranatense]|uniref:Secreted protein n=1 Tax=Erythroxylum novogranatense TaxID=1862640 RepID=A0AAV8SUC3_9ROSI|nr:hypothetical protein K2173_024446 [Erythroxylum novogranatense]